MDRAGALCPSDVVGEQDAETGGVRHLGGLVRAARFDRERPVVEQALQGPAGEAGHRRGLAQVDAGRLAITRNEHRDRSFEALGDQQQPRRVDGVGHRAVDQFGMHCDAGVGEQRPGCRRPGHDVDRPVGAERSVLVFPLAECRKRLPWPQREAHPDRWVFRVAVVLGHLVARQGGAAAGAVGLDLPALVEQVLAPEFGQRPPHRLDVGVLVGQVGAVHVEPVADPIGHSTPLPFVGADALEAGVVEPLDAVVLDLLLAGEAKLLLDLDLDRQAVGVPTTLAGHAPPGHRAEPGVEILDYAGNDMADVRHVVGGRRTFVERKLALVFVVAGCQRGLEHLLAAPELERLALEFGKRIAARNGRKRGIRGHGVRAL